MRDLKDGNKILRAQTSMKFHHCIARHSPTNITEPLYSATLTLDETIF